MKDGEIVHHSNQSSALFRPVDTQVERIFKQGILSKAPPLYAAKKAQRLKNLKVTL